MSNTTELGQLIDSTPEEFREHCRDKDLGYICGLSNLMKGTYDQVARMKDDLVTLLKGKPESSRTPEEKNTLNGLYAKLFAIEQKTLILQELHDERVLLTTQEVPPVAT